MNTIIVSELNNVQRTLANDKSNDSFFRNDADRQESCATIRSDALITEIKIEILSLVRLTWSKRLLSSTIATIARPTGIKSNIASTMIVIYTTAASCLVFSSASHCWYCCQSVLAGSAGMQALSAKRMMLVEAVSWYMICP